MRRISEERYQNLLKHEKMERRYNELVRDNHDLHKVYVPPLDIHPQSDLHKDIEAELLIAQVQAEAQRLKENETPDYKRGFDEGYKLRHEAQEELDKIYEPK